MSFRRTVLQVCLFATCLVATVARAQQAASPGPAFSVEGSQGVQLILENDVFSWSRLTTGRKEDRWYTNGMKVTYAFSAKQTPDFLLGDGLRLMSRIWCWEKTCNGQTAIAVGQMMYTPQNRNNPLPQPNDRFWAGWAYVAPVWHLRESAADRSAPWEDRVATLEVDVGAIGKYSGAEWLQRNFHLASGSTNPAGWNNQLKNELGVNVTYLEQLRFTADLGRVLRQDNVDTPFQDARADASMHYGFTAGSILNSVNTGATIRYGKNLKNVPVGTIDVPGTWASQDKGDNWYFFGRADLRAVLHNTFIQGSLFQSDPHATSIRRKPLVYTLSGGVSWGPWEWVRVSVVFNRRGKEFDTPPGQRAHHSFGSIIVELRDPTR